MTGNPPDSKVSEGRQPNSVRGFLGGMGMAAVPVVGLVLIGIIPGLAFFLILAVPYWILSTLAAPFVMRSVGLSVGFGVLAGCAVGAGAFCAAFYYLWLPDIIGN